MPITPGPWTPQRWWEQAGMTLADALDVEERQDWEAAPFKSIASPTGQVVSCHDLAQITPANARAMAAVPDLIEALSLAQATIARLDRKGSAAGTLDVIRAALAKVED